MLRAYAVRRKPCHIVKKGGGWRMGEELSLRACPRCHGDVCSSGDRFGDYRECLQCGHVEYANSVKVDHLLQDAGSGGGVRTKPSRKSSIV